MTAETRAWLRSEVDRRARERAARLDAAEAAIAAEPLVCKCGCGREVMQTVGAGRPRSYASSACRSRVALRNPATREHRRRYERERKRLQRLTAAA